jgi:hypothetical protein
MAERPRRRRRHELQARSRQARIQAPMVRVLPLRHVTVREQIVRIRRITRQRHAAARIESEAGNGHLPTPKRINAYAISDLTFQSDHSVCVRKPRCSSRFRRTTLRNSDAHRCVPVNDGVAPGFRGVCDTVLTQNSCSLRGHISTNIALYERASYAPTLNRVCQQSRRGVLEVHFSLAAGLPMEWRRRTAVACNDTDVLTSRHHSRVPDHQQRVRQAICLNKNC